MVKPKKVLFCLGVTSKFNRRQFNYNRQLKQIIISSSQSVAIEREIQQELLLSTNLIIELNASKADASNRFKPVESTWLKR